MSNKKQCLSTKARALIKEHEEWASGVSTASEYGNVGDYEDAKEEFKKSQAALEDYVLHLERTRRRLKDELSRTTAAYKLLLDRKE